MDNIITSKEVKFVNDPNNLSALAKIHEMSNKAKERRARKSPTHISHIHVDVNLNQEDNSKFSRRKNHFATMKYPAFNNNIGLLGQKDDILKGEGMRKSYVNNKEKTKGQKVEYVWDKNLNRLVEKKPGGLEKIDETEEKINTEKKYEPKKSDENEILQKLKDYKKSDSMKKTEVLYEKKVIKEDENEDDINLDKNTTGTKNTKIYKKIVKDDKGSKIIIEKIVEEVSGNKDDNLVFDDDSDDEDIEKELNTDKKDMKYQIIKEKFDPQGNKIYSKEIYTNKFPKGK